MGGSYWRPIGRVGFEQLREARLQAHYAAQWLARAARAYIPPQPGDNHTNLGWDGGFNGLVTHSLKDGTCLGVRIPDLTLALIDHGQIADSFPLDTHSENDARAWLRGRMQALQLPPEKLDTPLPYMLPFDALGRGARYEVTALAAPLSELAVWCANGASSLESIRQQLLARGLSAPDVRCWPHHFDLDCLTIIGNDGAVAAPTLGPGFSPGDRYYEEPYFYVSLSPRPRLARLPRVNGLGHWHMQDFLAAIIPADRILAAGNPQAETETLLETIVHECVRLLSNGAQRP